MGEIFDNGEGFGLIAILDETIGGMHSYGEGRYGC
jgi:hypothetical protein